MKKFVVVLMMIMVAISASAKNDWRGKVVDAQGEPVAYANVAVLSKADSTVVCGTVTQEDGSFNIVTKDNDGIMMVAMLGYQTVFLTPVDGSLVLRLEGRDLAGMAHFDVDSDFGSHTILQTNRMDSQKIKFSLRYKFNTAKSKYRETGAGADTRSRMQ